MTVKELRDLLAEMPDDLPVLFDDVEYGLQAVVAANVRHGKAVPYIPPGLPPLGARDISLTVAQWVQLKGKDTDYRLDPEEETT